MTKGTKIFRIIISILLALTMIISAFFALLFCAYVSEEVMEEDYGIYVAGVLVDRSNKDDVFGNGTVYYNSYNNILVFDNATIESEDTVVYSKTNLNIELIGENRLVCTDEEYGVGIYAGDYNLSKDLALIGEGSLTIEIPNATGEALGISASDLTVATDLTVVTPDCESMTSGIVCASSLIVVDKGTVTVNNGAADYYCSAVRVRGNALFEEGTSLNVSVNSGSSGVCKGFSVSGDLFLGKDTVLNVSLDDGTTNQGECIRVSGLMEIGIGSTVTASAKNTYAIECFGAIEANKGASVSAVSVEKDADIFCSGAVINYDADIEAVIDAIAGIHNRD